MSKWRSVLKSVVVLPVLSTLFTQSNYASERFDYQRVQLTQAGVDADVIQVKKLSDLQLFLNDPSQQPLLKFENIKKQLHYCERLEFAMNAGITLHINNQYGANNHHIAESIFKAVARVLRVALETDPRQKDAIPSTKGSLKG